MSLLALEASRVLGVLALLLCFAMLAGGGRHLAAQCGCIVGVALLQAWLQADPQLIAAAAAATGLGIFGGRNSRHSAHLPALPMFAVALALAVLAMVTAPAEIFAVPLAIVLLGLLLTTRTAGVGVICLVNGAVLGMALVPAMPLRGVASLALAAMVVVPPLAWKEQ